MKSLLPQKISLPPSLFSLFFLITQFTASQEGFEHETRVIFMIRREKFVDDLFRSGERKVFLFVAEGVADGN